MCWPNQHSSRSTTTALAAALYLSPSAFSQAAATPASFTPAPTSAAIPAQAANQSPAAEAAPRPVQIIPMPPSTPEDVGDAMMSHQRYQAAIEAYKQGPRSSAELWNKMGIAYQLMFNQDEASHCYQTSLRLDPKNSSVINNLGTVYDSEKEYGNAERLYRKAIKLEPRSGLIYKNLGTNLLAQHKYKKGWEMYQEALKIDPNIFKSSDSPRVQNPASVEDRGAMNYYMAKGCLRAGMNDCAIDYLRMALNEGFTSPKKIEADSEFAGLHGTPAFQQLLAEQKEQ
jgi:tetratricopeptide (TPR) repeat protein